MFTHAKLIVFILAFATITVAQQPKTVEGYIQSGIAFQRAGKHQEAIQDFAAALKLEPGNFTAQYGSGLSYMFLKKWEDAVAAFKAALILKPNEPFVHLSLAKAYGAGGRNSEALNTLKKAVALDPKLFGSGHGGPFRAMKSGSDEPDTADLGLGDKNG